MVQLRYTLITTVLVQDLCNKSVKNINEIKVKLKVKVHPVAGHEGPKGE